MADKQVYILEIDVDGKGAIKAMDKVEDKAKSTGKKVEKDLGGGFDAAGAALGKLKGAFLGIAAAIGTGAFLKESIDAAIKQENAINKLNTALRLTGNFSERTSQELQSFASGLQQVTTIGDETSLEMLGLALNYTKTTEQAKELYLASIDLAAATGTDLGTAVEQLGKTLTGTAGRLAEYDVRLRDVSKEQLKAGAAIDLIAAKFKGAAAAEATTFGGALTQMNNNLGDVLESVGMFITKSPTLIGFINDLSKSFAQLSTDISRARIDFFGTESEQAGTKIDRLKETIAKLEGQVATYTKKISEAKDEKILFGLVTSSASTVVASYQSRLNKIVPVLDNMKATLSDLTKDIKENGSAIDANAANYAKAAIDFQKYVQTIKDQRLALDVAAAQAITNSTEKQAALEALKAERILSINADLNTRLSALATEFKAREGATQEQYNEALLASIDIRNAKINQLDDELAKNNKARMEQITANIKNTLVNGISTGLQNVGAALAKGENAFAAFGNAVLSIMGDMAIQLGTMIIAEAIAIDTLSKSISNWFTAPAAIAAGIALVAIGGAIKAMAGGPSGSGAPTPSPTGGASGAIATTPVVGPEVLTPDQNQAININVEGTVLDPRSVGQQIAQILQDTFDSNQATVSYA